jgi:hypothetical protein
MRVCILGYDGLEYDIVEKLNLTQIKQREYGKVQVPIVGGIDDPSTPIVWTSFITGQPPEVHGVDMPEVWDNAFDGFRSFIRKHKTLYGISRRFKVGYKVRGAIGIEAKFPSRKNIKCPTLFDEIDPSIPIGIPVFNKNLSKIYPVGEVIKVRQDPSNRLNFEKKNRELFVQEVETLFQAIKKDWKLLMIHFHITDLFGHVFWGTEKLITLYEEINNLTKKVKMELKKDDLVLIISDHGMSKLGHTKEGFYSLSQKFGLKNPDITDFFKIILNFLD